MNPAPDLIVPVYLNQRLVFDLVAMLQGGIATVTRVAEAQRDTEKLQGEITGTFGLGQALASLLRVDLSGKVGSAAEGSSERTHTEERVHTPASLFYLLRGLLVEKGVLVSATDESSIVPGQFVEFTASLRRNPLIEAVDSVVEMIDLISVFIQPQQSTNVPAKKGSKLPANELGRVRVQLESLSSSLKAGGTRDLIADKAESPLKALLIVEEQYLNDRSLSDLVDGTFRVVGKVTRVVRDSSGSINLLRKTAMSRLPPNMLQSLTAAFATLKDEQGFTVPTIEVELRGPIIQLLPLAIFS